MKKLLFIAALSASLFTIGCATPATRVATTVAGAQVITVDAAMKAWADYSNSGKSTQAQIDAVASIYAKYYQAAQAEKAALIAFQAAPENQPKWQTALTVVQSCESELIALVQSLTK